MIQSVKSKKRKIICSFFRILLLGHLFKVLLFAIGFEVNNNISANNDISDVVAKINGVAFWIILLLTCFIEVFWVKPSTIRLMDNKVVYQPMLGKCKTIPVSQFENIKTGKIRFSKIITKYIPIVFTNYRGFYKENSKITKIPLYTHDYEEIMLLWNEIIFRKTQMKSNNVVDTTLADASYFQKNEKKEDIGLAHCGEKIEEIQSNSIRINIAAVKSYSKWQETWLKIILGGAFLFSVLCFVWARGWESEGRYAGGVVAGISFYIMVQIGIFWGIIIWLVTTCIFICLTNQEKNVPKWVYINENYIQFDYMKYDWSEIKNVKMVNPESRRDKFIEFVYFQEKYRYEFGAYKLFSKTGIDQYSQITSYFRNRGFYYYE